MDRARDAISDSHGLETSLGASGAARLAFDADDSGVAGGTPPALCQERRAVVRGRVSGSRRDAIGVAFAENDTRDSVQDLDSGRFLEHLAPNYRADVVGDILLHLALEATACRGLPGVSVVPRSTREPDAMTGDRILGASTHLDRVPRIARVPRGLVVAFVCEAVTA